MADLPRVGRVLRQLGVPLQDQPDVLQSIALAAWQAIQADRFRPPPELPVDESLRRWLRGIAWRQASNHNAKPARRRERAAGLLLDVLAGGHEIEARLDAVRVLSGAIPRKLRPFARLAAHGHGQRDIALALRLPAHTVANRLRALRLRLAALVGRG